jgi:hypothetical protein
MKEIDEDFYLMANLFPADTGCRWLRGFRSAAMRAMMSASRSTRRTVRGFGQGSRRKRCIKPAVLI